MKRIIILTLLCICNILSFAQSFKEEYGGYNVHYLQYTVMDPQALTVRCQIGPSANYSNGGFYAVVPASVSYKGIEYSVVSIGSIVNVPNMLKSISLPNTIKTIEYSAFKGCTGLTEINIPSGVRDIYYQAFYGCTNLAKIQVPSSVVFIAPDAFYNTKWLSNQPDGIVYPSDKVAYGFKGIMNENEDVSIKEGVVSISPSAFANYGNLVSVSFPNTLETICSSSFSGCGLSSVSLPASVEKIESNAFANNTSLKEVTIAESSNTLDIASTSFASCPIEKVSYGRNCSSSMFKNLNALTEVEIGKSVTQLESDEFSGCNNLTKIVYNSERPIIGTVNFANANTVYVPKKGLVNFFTAEGWKDIENIYCIDNGKRYFALYTNISGEKLTKVNGDIGNCVAIAEGDLMTITASKSLTKEDHVYLNGMEITSQLPYTTQMIRNCTLVEISGNAGQTIELSTAGTLLSKLGNVSVLPTIENLTITGPLNGTDLKVIREMTNLKYLNIADAWFVAGGSTYYSSYTTKDGIIPQYAFYKMPELRTLILPDEGTEIGTYMAAECPKLENCEVGDKVITLGQYAFADCPMLGYINTGKATRSIGNNAFLNCTNLEQVVFGSDCATISSSAFLNCINIKKLILPKKITDVSANTFKGCTALREVVIPENVRSIGTYAFADCSSLKKISCYASTPPTVTSTTFQNVSKSDCELAVPQDVYTDYYLANYWKDFVSLNSISLYSLTYKLQDQKYLVEKYQAGDVVIPQNDPILDEGVEFMGWEDLPTIMPAYSVTVNGYYRIAGGEIILNNTELSIAVGEVAQLIATVQPEQFNENGVIWSSSDENVATVNSDGIVVAKQTGIAIITASTKYLSATCKIKVVMNSDNILTTTDVMGKAGKTVLIPVSMTNKTDVYGVQCDIYLSSDKIAITKDSRGRYVFTQNADRVDGQTASSKLQSDGAVRFMIADYTAENPFSGKEGELFYISIDIPQTLEGEQTVSIKNITLATDEKKILCPDIESKITIQSYTLGDVDDDGIIDVQDVLRTAQLVLNSNYNIAADMDEDNLIDVQDVIMVARAVLEQDNVAFASIKAPAMVNENKSITDYLSICSVANGTCAVILNNAEEYHGFQMDIELPVGYSFAQDANGNVEVDFNDAKLPEVTVMQRLFSDNKIRIMVFDDGQNAMKSNVGKLFNFKIQKDNAVIGNTCNVRISNVVFSHDNGKVKFGGLVRIIDISDATSINSLSEDASKQNIYSVDGKKVKTPAKNNTYIINGKKITIK